MTGATLPTPRAVLFDVDFTLLEPGDMFEAEGYRRCAAEFGIELDISRWESAEAAAYAAVRERRRQHGNTHDEGVYSAIAEAILVGLGAFGPDGGAGASGGDASAAAAADPANVRHGADPVTIRACAEAVIAAWTDYANFSLYDDVLPCLATLRGAGLKLALVSNTSRSLQGVVEHFDLGDYIDATIASSQVGMFKPAPEIYQAALDALGVGAGEAVMVGDNPNDDIKGALSAGLAGAVLVDRKGYWEFDVPIVRSLAELPVVLGL